MPLARGTRLGSYTIVEPLGAGGMGEVYRATQANLDREVAIKVLSPELAGSPERLRRFEQESRAASALNHPNIISIYDVGSENGASYIAMELVEGRDLRAMLSNGPLAIKKCLQLATQIAEGLAKAHSVGIVHRDLKPENIMVTRDGFVKILDFGVAKLQSVPAAPRKQDETVGLELMAEQTHGAQLPAPLTNPGMIMGTAAYMSPEQARGAPLDFRSDIFSFGTILYEMAAGVRPFTGESTVQVMAAIIEDEPKTVTEVNPRVPIPLRWTIERCLAKDAEDRYASTRDLARDLASQRDHISGSETVTAAAATAALPRHHPRAWLKGMMWAAGGAIVATAITFFALYHAAAPPVVLHEITFSGMDFSPSLSPDGRMVAFVSSRDGNSRIWLKELATSSETAVTAGPNDTAPRFSPDGSWILFRRGEALYRMPVLGGETRKLLDGVQAADWSPHGRRIVFLRAGEGKAVQELGIASAEDGSFQIIHRFDDGNYMAPAWSPDGKWIALEVFPAAATMGSAQRYVALVSADGKTVRKVICPLPGGELSAPSWADAGHLLYVEPEEAAESAALTGEETANGLNILAGSPGRVLLEDIDSGKTKELFSVPAPVYRILAAGEGRVLFDSFVQRNSLKEIPLAGARDSAHWLTRGFSIDRQPVYAPDGKSVVFSSSRTGGIDLWEVNTATNALRRLTDHPATDWDPALSSDGKYLLWSSNRGGHFEVWMAERDGSGPHALTSDGYDAENPAASPDGWVVYISGNPQHPGLWKIRMDASQATQLARGDFAWPDVSRDGKYALYDDADESIRVVQLADGTAVPFTAKGARARFAPDGKSIVYISMDGKQIVSQPFPAASGSKETVVVPANLDYDIETFALAPDGQHITVSYAEPSVGLVMATNVPDMSGGK